MPNQTPIPAIIERNRDVEPLVYASARYGHHGFGRKNKDKLFSMLISTDLHHCAPRLEAAIAYLNAIPSLDCGLCLGDILAANYAEEATWYVHGVAQAQKPFLSALGNHDMGNSADVAISATTQMAFEKLIAPTAAQIGIEPLRTPYYVRFFEEYKIAILVLHAFDTPSEQDGAGHYTVHRGTEMLSQAQVDWLVRTLSAMPSGYHVAIAMHAFPYQHEPEPGPWTQKGKGLGANGWDAPYGDTALLPTLMQAWINGTCCHTTFTPRDARLPAIWVDADFSARGDGAFIGYFVGHYHRDVVAHCSQYPQQKIIAFASAADDDWQNYDSDLPRAAGTKAEDLLTVCSIDTVKREIRLVRIGSCFTMEMQERRYALLSYAAPKQ